MMSLTMERVLLLQQQPYLKNDGLRNTEKRKESPTARGYHAGNSNNSGLRIAAKSKNCIFSNEQDVQPKP